MENTNKGSLNHHQNPLAVDSMGVQFCKYFKIVVADTPALREDVYRIRYKVYCQELRYEREEDCRDGMERDIYDSRSIHCLLMHRASGLYAGCARLVLAAHDDPEAKFPFEKVCGDNLLLNSIDLNNFTRYCSGEVSRLAVTSEFRKRKGEALVEHGVSEEIELVDDERRHFPLIALGLYLATISIILEGGFDNAFSIMEPRLARHLRRFGVPARQIGDVVEYHGKRGPFHATSEEILKGLHPEVYELLQMIRCDIKMSVNRYIPAILQSRAAS